MRKGREGKRGEHSQEISRGAASVSPEEERVPPPLEQVQIEIKACV